MSTTPTQQPEALRLADTLDQVAALFSFPAALLLSAAELRRQHAEIARLTDAYCGAREDLAIWKRRALEAEEKLRAESTVSARLVSELNDQNGPTHMGEPARKRKPLTDVEKHAMWVMATIDQCSHEQCYLRGIADSESAHGIGEKA